MPGDDVRFDAKGINERAEAQAQRLDAHQIDLAAEQPARVIFAKAGGFHHRLGFVGISVRFQ